MADKKITDLTLRADVSAEVNFPVDDGIQSYRVTAAQVKDFILPDEGVTRAKIIEAQRIPVGAIFPFSGTTVPAGFLICQGAAVSRTTYADLFAAIGITHGQGDGSTTFNLPETRGLFLRGVSNGSTNDPDRASRQALTTGANTGDNVGSWQGHAFQSHLHSQPSHAHSYTDSHDSTKAIFTSAGGSGMDNRVGYGKTTGGASPNTNNATASGGASQVSANETRPINIYVNFIIKF